jgi:tetratricopeptide (TPR) repeat protein/energy-coupling factor transporter ATP-binding protein EcfA2
MSDFTPHEASIHEAQALPVTVTGKLVGREAALAQVYGQLKGQQPVLVYGPAGSGKTALAATLASAYAQQPGGVLWLPVERPRLEELLVRVGRAYHIREITDSDNPLAMVGAVENTLRHHKPFIVLDGSIQPDVASRFISRCVDGLPLLITSENELDGAWMTVGLGKLEADQGVQLFKQEARLPADSDDGNINGMVELVDYLPFGIVVAARAMMASKKSPAEFIKVMQPLAASTGSHPNVALTTSFRALNGALQGLLLMMGATFTGSASARLLSIVSNAPQDTVQQAMNILAQLGLVTRSRRYGEFYYRIHPLTYQFARAALRSSNRLDDLEAKIKTAVLAYAEKHSADTLDAHNSLAMEMETFLATARWAVEHGQRIAANDLVKSLRGAGDFLRERGYLYELVQLREMGAGAMTAFPAHPPEDAIFTPPEDEEDLVAEDLLEDEEDELEDVDDLDGDDDLGFPEEDDEEDEEEDDELLAAPAMVAPEDIDPEADDITRLRAALTQVRQSGDKSRLAELLKGLGKQQVGQELEDEAIATYGELLTVYEEVDDRAGVLDTLDMLSALLAKTDNLQAAVMHASRGIKLAAELEDRETQMHLQVTLGDARQQLGESAEAAENYSGALAIARTREDSQNEAIILYKLGYAQLDNAEPERAIDNWEQALALFKEQDKRSYEGRVLGALGSAYGDLDRWAEAVNFHTSALYIAREIGDRDEEALQLTALAFAATQARQLGEAVLRYRQALHLAYESQNRDNIVSTIVDLCRLLLQSRKHLSVAELLIEDALALEPNDKDVLQLKEHIDNERTLAASRQTKLIEVTGTAQDYAANAYRLLEEA